jgi:hypothetical protein
MNLIYWLFAIIKKVVPFETEQDRVTLENEMKLAYNNLDEKGKGVGSVFKRVTMSVWFRFVLVLLFVPVHRWVYNMMYGSTSPEDYDNDEYEE